MRFRAAKSRDFADDLPSLAYVRKIKTRPYRTRFEWVRSLEIADKRLEESDAFFHRFDVHVLV